MIKKAPLLIVLIPLFLLITPAYAGNATIQTTAGLIQITTPGMVILPAIPPDYTPKLREYEINKDHDIWHAEDVSSYITPDNEWVKYYASQLYIRGNGDIRYKNYKIPYVRNYTGEIESWVDAPFTNEYISDDSLFNNPANEDLWQNADYYLTHGFKGDCEDWSISVTSMMLSGEMSVLENGQYKKQVIPAKSIIGYNDNKKVGDVWTEYIVYNTTFITTTWTSKEGYGDVSTTSFVNKNELDDLIPMFEFTNEFFRRVS